MSSSDRSLLDHLRDEQPSVNSIIQQFKICYETWGEVSEHVDVSGKHLSNVRRKPGVELSDEQEKLLRLQYDKMESRHTIAFDMGILVKQAFQRIREGCSTIDEARDQLDKIESRIDEKVDNLNANA